MIIKLKTWNRAIFLLNVSVLIILFIVLVPRQKSSVNDEDLHGFPDSTYLSSPVLALSQEVSEENIHLSPICGHWQKSYSDLHKRNVQTQITSGRGRLLIFSNGGAGIGDNFVGMTSALMLSIIFRRAFLLNWPDLSSTGLLLPSIFDWSPRDGIDVKFNESISFRQCDDIDLKQVTSVVHLDLLNYGDVRDSDYVFECLNKLNEVPALNIRMNRGFTVWAYENSLWKSKLHAYGFRLPFVTGCLLRSLIKPSKKLLHKVYPYLVKLRRDRSNPSVCIHSRYGTSDDEFHKEKMMKYFKIHMRATMILISCAEKLSSHWGNPLSEKVWFFMSGFDRVKRSIALKFKNIVVSTPFSGMHVMRAANKTSAFENAISEWFIFTKCDFFVFHDSGMSKSAWMYSLRPTAAFMFSRNDLAEDCDPSVPSTIYDIATSWSGV